jgi:lipid II:glycine glycyltransferase (peptidoglycan interpeptide bridge formation enzyme)
MEGRCRTAIRKAEKSGVTVVRETGRECIAPYYEILSALYAAQGRSTPNPREFYLELWDRFSRRGLIVLTARHESATIAGALLLHDRDTVYYLNGCSLHAHNHLNPNSLIQWEAIQLAKTSGAHRYDFVGSDIERLAKFKRSFGGAEVAYTLIEHAGSRWVHAARRHFPAMKRLASQLRSRLQ